MDELYAIMRDLLEVEYNQQSLLWILQAVEATESPEMGEDVKYITNSVRYYLEAVQKELREGINRLDDYALEVGHER